MIGDIEAFHVLVGHGLAYPQPRNVYSDNLPIFPQDFYFSAFRLRLLYSMNINPFSMNTRKIFLFHSAVYLFTLFFAA